MNPKTSPIKTFITLVLLVLAYPVGVLVMWIWTKWPEGLKITLTVLGFLMFFVLPVIFYVWIAQPHKVSGPAMHPTLSDEDYFITEKVSYKFSSPQRGDVITFEYPGDHSVDFIKRVIGLPGETVKIDSGKVLINRQMIDEPYLTPDVFTRGGIFLPENSEKVIPEGNYFVLGDSRDHSSDSREWGFVKKEEILGKYWFRYYKSPTNGVGENDPPCCLDN